MRKNKYLIMVLLCVIVCCNFSGCGRLNFIAPEKKMESYLERKYDEDFEYVEGSLSGSSDSAYTFVWDTTGYTAEFISEENPDIVVTCGYGDDFSDTYRDELFRKQFKELMYEYSSQFLPVSIMYGLHGMRELNQLMKIKTLRSISKMIRDFIFIYMLKI